MDGRLFGLDIQLLFDVCIVFVFIMVLYVIMSRFFFKPVRAVIEARRAVIEADKEAAKDNAQAADKFRAEYEVLLKTVNKEAENPMSASLKSALKKQDEIISDAKVQALAIIEQANKDADMEMKSVRDEVKAEMTEIAAAIAGQFVTSKDPFREAMLLEENLKEMGGEAWQNS